MEHLHGCITIPVPNWYLRSRCHLRPCCHQGSPGELFPFTLHTTSTIFYQRSVLNMIYCLTLYACSFELLPAVLGSLHLPPSTATCLPNSTTTSPSDMLPFSNSAYGSAKGLADKCTDHSQQLTAFAADVWAVGQIAVQLYSGRPFLGDFNNLDDWDRACR